MKEDAAPLIHKALLSGDIEGAKERLFDALKGEKTSSTGITKTSSILKLSRSFATLLKDSPIDVGVLKSFWEISLKDMEHQVFGVMTGREIRLFLIGAFSRLIGRKNGYVHSFLEAAAPLVMDWETCDQMAMKVIAPLILKGDDRIWELLETWAKSKYPWTARLPVATFPPLIRKNPELAERLLKYVKMHMNRKEPALKKAVEWAINEYYKNRPQECRRFLSKLDSPRAKRFLEKFSK